MIAKQGGVYSPLCSTFVLTNTEGNKLGILEIKSAIKLTSIPACVSGNSNFTILWSVFGRTTGEINYTAVHWGYESGGANRIIQG
ncbi:MAG: hypothetical protein KKI06_05855 [Euryarchaeota archaeon]|nr:hypothetical protein [Euryarchaeota archaeon]